MSKKVNLLLVSLLCLAGMTQAWGQAAYPSRPVRLLIPFAPGGATDLFARKYAEKLGKRLGQPIVTDNKAGAGGIIAAAETARAKPDGYTLFFATSTTLAILPSMMTTPQYDVDKDFQPIALIGKTPLLLVVHAGLPAKSVAELVALIKANRTSIPMAPRAWAAHRTWRGNCSSCARATCACCTSPTRAAARRCRMRCPG